MRIVLLVALLLVGTAASSLAQVIQTKTLVSSGGAHSSAGSLMMSSNIGDAISGFSQGAPHEVWHGFYAPDLTQFIGVDDQPRTVASFLGRISPNPACGPLTIEFGNAVAQTIRLEIYDLGGRRVRRLHDGQLDAGVYRREWDLQSDRWSPVDAGIYFVRLVTPDYQRTDRVVVLH